MFVRKITNMPTNNVSYQMITFNVSLKTRDKALI